MFCVNIPYINCPFNITNSSLKPPFLSDLNTKVVYTMTAAPKMISLNIKNKTSTFQKSSQHDFPTKRIVVCKRQYF